MAQRTTCPTCGNPPNPGLASGPVNCTHCDELLEFTTRDGWVIASAHTYRPMDAVQAQEVIDRYSPDQPFSIGPRETAELVEAIQVLAGAPLAQVHRMREVFLGPGVND